MNALPEFDALLIALREAKVPVGVRETLRLQQLLAAGSAVDREGLRLLLGCLLARTGEERAALDRVFEAWWERMGAAVEEVLVAAAPGKGGSERGEQRPQVETRVGVGKVVALAERKRPWWGMVGGVAGGVVVAALVVALGSRMCAVPAGTGVDAGAGVGAAVDAGAAAHRENVPDKRTFRGQVPVIELTSPDYLPSLLALVASLIGAGTALGLWLGLRRRAFMPEPKVDVWREGAAALPRAPAEPPADVLLGDDGRDQLVWGIGRHVGDESSHVLDVERTVRATARAGGLPELRYRRAGHYRSVWLWLDDAAEDPTLPRIAREIEAALEQAGLPVERATYWGVPDVLYGTDGVRLAAGDLEERQASAAVALLTDGRALSIRYAAAERRRRIDALLRGLGRWPRLGFVDFGGGIHGLDRIAGRHEIPVLRPEGLVAFLTDEAVLREAMAEGDTRAWAAACALAPGSAGPVDEATAWALRKHLDLAVTPWALRGLLREGRIQSGQEERAQLLDWLRLADGRVGKSETAPVPEKTLLFKALEFWKQRLEEQIKAADDAWRGTRAERAARIDRAVLDLWDEPGKAVESLYHLAGGEGRALVEQRLREYTAEGLSRELGGEALVVFPWTWAKQRPLVRVMLQELGFGGAVAKQTTERLRRPGRFGLGIGLSAGLSAGALVGAMAKLPGSEGLVGCESRPDEDRWCVVERGGEERQIVASTPYGEQRRSLSRPEWVAVRFKEVEIQCEMPMMGRDAVRLLCGEVGQPRPRDPARKARRSVAWIEAAPWREDARALAVRLLDTRSADEVILAPKEPPTRPLAAQDGIDQMIVIQPGTEAALTDVALRSHGLDSLRGVAVVATTDLEKLRDALGEDQVAPIGKAWPGARVLYGQVELMAPRATPPPALTCPEGMALIPAGKFWMGSTEDDKDADTDERPRHEVTLDAFCMDNLEVTVAQYRRCEKEARNGLQCTATGVSGSCNEKENNREDHPINCVDWNQADGYCRWADGRLPTEAEWEYAARGTDGRIYPWGNTPPSSQLCWDSEGSDLGVGNRHTTCPVGRYPAGASPFGLFDMAGNVWEWTADAYGSYDKGGEQNPTRKPQGDEPRVLRGGSWIYFWAPRVRAAGRGRGVPASRFGGVGFRCARGVKQ